MPDSRKNLRDITYDYLRERIRDGRVGQNDRLVDHELAALLGISRMPVREALMQLANEGYVQGTTRGYMLRRFSSEDVRKIFEIRLQLEPYAAQQAAPHMDEPALHALREALRECQAAYAAGDATSFTQSNAAFRAAWFARVPNEHLVRILERHIDHVQVVRLATLTLPKVQKLVLGRMALMLDAFERRDGKLAGARMKQQTVSAERSFFAAASAAGAG